MFARCSLAAPFGPSSVGRPEQVAPALDAIFASRPPKSGPGRNRRHHDSRDRRPGMAMGLLQQLQLAMVGTLLARVTRDRWAPCCDELGQTTTRYLLTSCASFTCLEFWRI